MTAIATRLLVVLLVYGAAPCVSAGAQTRLDPNFQERVSQAAPEHVAIDIARIRRLLGEPQPPGSGGGLPGLASMLTVEFIPQPVTVDMNGMLRFKETVNVVAFKWNTPTLAEQLEALEKESRFPYSYAPSLQELSARIPGLQYLHPVNAIVAANKAIRGALYRAKVEKARREVAAELRAIQAHNAAMAAADSKPPQKEH
jgi:hypothetical protein